MGQGRAWKRVATGGFAPGVSPPAADSGCQCLIHFACDTSLKVTTHWARGPQGVEALHSTAPFVAHGATSEQDRPTSCQSTYPPFLYFRPGYPASPLPPIPFSASCRHALSSFYIPSCCFFFYIFLTRFKPAAAVTTRKEKQL